MVEGAATVQGQLIAAESELKGIEQIYSANNVRVRTLRARVAELQQQLANLVGSNSAAQGSMERQTLSPAHQATNLDIRRFDNSLYWVSVMQTSIAAQKYKKRCTRR